MKKAVFLLLMVVATVAQTQTTESYAEFFAGQFATETNGYISGRQKTESLNSCFVQPPSFYDFDLVRMASKSIVNTYSDVKVLHSWEADPKNPTSFREWWITDDQFYVILTYVADKKYMIISVAKVKED